MYASSGALVPLAGHGSLVLVFRGLSKPQRAGQSLISSVWNAVNSVGPQIKLLAFIRVCTPFYIIISL